MIGQPTKKSDADCDAMRGALATAEVWGAVMNASSWTSGAGFEWSPAQDPVLVDGEAAEVGSPRNRERWKRMPSMRGKADFQRIRETYCSSILRIFKSVGQTSREDSRWN